MPNAKVFATVARKQDKTSKQIEEEELEAARQRLAAMANAPLIAHKAQLVQQRPEQVLARQQAIRDNLLKQRMVIDPNLIQMEGLEPIDPNLIQMTDDLYAEKLLGNAGKGAVRGATKSTAGARKRN